MMKTIIILLFGANVAFGQLSMPGALHAAAAAPPSGGAPVVAGNTQNDSGGTWQTTLDLTKPSGVSSDDLLILVGCSDDSGPSTSWNTLSGWTQIGPYNDAASDCELSIWWRIADGTEGATTTITRTGANAEINGFYIHVTGASSTTPIHLTSAAQYYSVSNWDITGVTTTTADCLVLAIYAADGGDLQPMTSSGTGWTQGDSGGTGATASNDSGGGWSKKTMSGTGATGTVTVTPAASDGASAIQIAIAP